MNNPRTDPNTSPRDPVPTGLRIRSAVRAVIMSADRHVLLVRFEFPAGTRWALPGGGLAPGEDHLAALRRELDEELGFDPDEIGPHIWTREHHIAFPDGQWDGQHEHIHLVTVDEPFVVRPRWTWEQLRDEHMHEIRWWPVEEIGRDASTVFVPHRLHHHLNDLIANGPPAMPFDVEP